MASLKSGVPTQSLVSTAFGCSKVFLESTQDSFERISSLLSRLRTSPQDERYQSFSSRLSTIYGKTQVFGTDGVQKLAKPISAAEFDSILKSGSKSIEHGLVSVAGWCKTVRIQESGKLAFVILNDGSCKANLQVVVHKDAKGYSLVSKCSSGCSIRTRGTLVERPKKAEVDGYAAESSYETLEQVSSRYEIQVCDLDGHSVEVVGENRCPSKYPIAKKYTTHEYLREVAHLRPRSYFISAVMRVRNALALSTHLYFQKLGCIYLNTPLITTADCEGGGELFQVTTLLEGVETMGDLVKKVTGESPSKSSKTLEEILVDYKKDFFKKKAFLTCSGQLSGENYACSMGRIYTFGPTFRAEISHTNRHLAEFWMVEPELDFVDLPMNMEIAEGYVKFVIQFILDHCMDDLLYFEETTEKGLVAKLKSFVEHKFARITYTDVIEILKKHEEDFQAGLVDLSESEVGTKREDDSTERRTAFEHPVYWGVDLQSEHERFIAESVFKKPVIIYNYPTAIKAFYMRRNPDGKTCAAMDLIVPRFGELIGGSQREERLEVLEASISECGLNPADYWWYLDLRTYGSIPHSGFGLGFERLVMIATGVSNIRDVIPFPRYVGHAEF